MTKPSTRANSRRRKSAGARNRGVQGTAGAAAIAGLLVTAEAMVAERPKKEGAQPPMLGGMGGMDY